MRRIAAIVLGLAVCSAADARADGLELIVLGGVAVTPYEQTLRLSSFRVDRVDAQPAGNLVIEGKNGPAFGIALAFEFARVLAVEGRFDRANLDLVASAIRYDLTAPGPAGGAPLTGALTLGEVTLSLDPLSVWSLNLRVRSPGPVSVFASGGLSRRPRLTADATVPVTLRVPGVLELSREARLQLLAEPEDAAERFGGNAGIGLRADVGSHLSLLAEARVFAFKTHELQFSLDVPGLELDVLGERIASIRFEPVYVQGSGGIVVRF